MDFTLNVEQQARFRERIQTHRDVRGEAQKAVAARIKVGGDMSQEISRFENGQAATLARWLTAPYLEHVAIAYGFASSAELLRLFDDARSGAPAPTTDSWHPAFPGVDRSTMELPRRFRFVRDAESLYSPRVGGKAEDAIGAVPPNFDRIAVVVDATSGVDTVRRQLERAMSDAQRARLVLEIVDARAARKLPLPAILVDDWDVSRLLGLLDRLPSSGHFDKSQSERVRAMLEQVPGGSLAGLPISLVLDAVATEARSSGPRGHLHRHLVVAEWQRAVERHPGGALANSDLGIYTDFWAEVAVASEAQDYTVFEEASGRAAASAVLARRGWEVPDAAQLASRAVKVARVKSVPERERLIGEIAVELRRPTADRLLDAFVEMGLLAREDGVLRAAAPAVATLAAAWGLANRPDLLRGRHALLCLPRAGDLMADIAAFGAKPSEVWAALDSVPDWALVDRDHALIRFAAACPDLGGLRRLAIADCWSRVLYERSGHGRWIERLWADGREVLALDQALRRVSEQLRVFLPVFGDMAAFIESIDVTTRERIDALALHPIISDPQDPGRCLGALAQLAPWQFPLLDDEAASAVEEYVPVRWGLDPKPDPVEIASWACLAGFEPARAWPAGAHPASMTYGRLPVNARLVAACQPDCPDEARRRAREHAFWLLAQPRVDLDGLRQPIQLDVDGFPLLHRALGIDRAPRSQWDAIVEVIRSTGGMPPRTGELAAAGLSDGARCALAEALGHVDELIRIEAEVDTALAAGRLSTHLGEVHAFGVRMSSRHSRYRLNTQQPTERPLTQLATGLLAADAPGHAAAVALFHMGHPEALRRRARGELPTIPASTRRAWLDCWRLADLWDAPLERVHSLLCDAQDVLVDIFSSGGWEHDGRDEACTDGNTLSRLGVDRPDLSTLALAFSRLRHCRAASNDRALGNVLRLPMDDRLAEFCDRLRGDPPAPLDLQLLVQQRAARAAKALAEAGDVEVLRSWKKRYREESHDMMGDIVQRSVAEVLKTSAPLRAMASKEAKEPGAQLDLITWAIDAGEPFPTWLRAAIDDAASRGEGYVLWFKQAAFRRQRLVCIRAHGADEAAALACLWFEDACKLGDDEIVAQYAEVVLEWAATTDWPFVSERGPLALRGLHHAAVQPETGEEAPAAPTKGPPWRELASFFEAAIRDRRVNREKTVSVLEQLWDRLMAPQPSPKGSSAHISQGITQIFDDLARLLIAAGAPNRIEAFLRRGIPAPAGGTAELFQARALERFRPPGFDPRWMLGQGAQLDTWAWRQLAARGDDDAIERLLGTLRDIDLAEGRWLGQEAVLSVLIRHRRDVVVAWLMNEAARSKLHAAEARGLVVAWAHAWGPRSAELAAWARGAPLRALSADVAEV